MTMNITGWIVKTLLKLVSYETLVSTIAQAIAYVLEYARTSSSPQRWNKAKSTISKVKNWMNLFEEVYEDDKLTEEEEKKIQDAIANCTATHSIYDLIQGRKPNTDKIQKSI